MTTLAYYLHNLNPVIFELGPLRPRWYGVAYLLGFLGAYVLIKKLSRDGMLRLQPERIPDLVLNCCIFGVLIGGRLGFCLLYDLPNALQNGRTPLLWFNGEFPYWGVLRVWEGGMSAHGGVLFTVLTLMIFSWRQHDPKLGLLPIIKLVGGVFVFGGVGWALAYLLSPDDTVRTMLALLLAVAWLTYFGWRKAIPVTNIGDAACMVVPIGLCFGRIANFINGELYGNPTTVSWAVQFPSEIYAPTNGVIEPSVLQALLQKGILLPGESVDVLARSLQQHQPVAMEAMRAILPPRHPSQLYEALLEGVLLLTICWLVGRLWRKEGMASGAFLTFYPVMRIIGEQFRVGDTPIHMMGMDISKGVLYSLPMVLAGAVYWGYWIRRDRRIPWNPAGAA